MILTHDVDWPPAGPGLQHVLARRERFDPDVIRRAENEGFNPYNNIDSIMEMERENGLRSTFFFRPTYDDGTPVSAYSHQMGRLLSGGWEVGAHLNNAGSLESVAREREEVGSASGAAPLGCRVHYLRLEAGSHSFMRRAGFAYDSSVEFSKEEVTPRNAGFLVSGGLLVFPITIMDTYLFTYMKVPEERVLGVIDSAIDMCRDRGYMTILWHDTSILMKGGRAYAEACKMLGSRSGVECVTAGDAYRSVPREVGC